MSDLVKRLSDVQPISARLRPVANPEALRAAIDRGLVHILFTETRGGTELSVRLDQAGCNLDGGDFAAARGEIKLAGTLVLDYVPVRFEGTLALDTLRGQGALRPIDAGAAA